MRNKGIKIAYAAVLFLIIAGVKAEGINRCEMSESYKYWASLPEVERNKRIMPEYCKPPVAKGDETINAVVRSSNLPSSYRSTSGIVRDQKQTGSCGAMTSTTTLESFVKRRYNVDYTLSAWHLYYHQSQSFSDISINRLGTNRSVNSGLTFKEASYYFINRYGPVFEDTVPTVTDTTPLPLKNSKTIIGLDNVLDVQEIELWNRDYAGACSSSEKNKIKSLIYNNGPVGAYMNTSQVEYYKPYNYKSGNTVVDIDHAVTIIGWDDNYSNTNNYAGTKPNSNGAWIVQNSWGTDFGNNGVFYVSYEDDMICTMLLSVKEADASKVDNRYVSAHEGMDTYAYSPATMAVFNKQNSLDEYLSKVSFEVTEPSDYKVYYYPGNAGANDVSLDKMQLIASGTAEHAGFYTVFPNKSIIIPNQYSIAVYSNSGHSPIAYQNYVIYEDNVKKNVTAAETFGTKQSYILYDGSWDDLYDLWTDNHYKSVISAFTKNVNLQITDVRVKYTYSDFFTVYPTIKANEDLKITGLRLTKDGKTIKTYGDFYSSASMSAGTTRTFTMNSSDSLANFVNGTYKLEVDTDGGLTYSYNVPINVKYITGISITNKAGTKLAVGKTMNMTVAYNPTDHNSTNPKLTWTSSNPSVASVDENGVVTGVSVGTTKITATTTNGYTATFDLVVNIPITGLELNKTTVNLNVGKTYQLTGTITPDNTTESKTITWSSSNTAVATVSNGLITAKASGTATIKATVGGITKTVAVSVNGVSLNKTSASVELYKTYKLVATVINSNPDASKAVVWSSNNTAVATVSGGVVTTKKVGTAVITAKDSFGRSAKATITVVKAKASNFTISAIPVKTYTGKAIKPAVTVKYLGKKLVKGTDYTVKYSNNKNPGKATVTITAASKSAKYTGSKTVNFIIKPKKTPIKAPTTKNKTITVKWTWMTKVNTYEIQYRIKGTSTWKSIKVRDGNMFVIKSLTKGKTYQIRIRGYITVDKKVYNGAWSKTKTIKCK